MYTLGINAAFHDCSAALLRDGQVLAAAEEERFTRVKHGKRPLPFTAWQLPFHAIDYCLAQAGIRLRDVQHIAYAFDPALLDHSAVTPEGDIRLPLEPSRAGSPQGGTSPWDPLFLSYITNAPRQLAAGAPLHLSARFEGLSLAEIQQRWVFLDHHLCHEASAYLAAPLEAPAVLTLDGRGEGVTTSYGHFSGGEYSRLKQIAMPHSLGLLYEDVTRHLGFLHASDEYKVMALASYGKPSMRQALREILRLEDDGGFSLAPADLAEVLGPPRRRGEAFDDRHKDIASSLQHVLEETVLHMAGWLHRQTGAK
ncbi:carbamoyltransferase, partial [Bordetella hinzii]|nr:carbamoyltransferase [Bordetella hinzii]